MPIPRSKRRFRCLNCKSALKTPFSSIKSAFSSINTCASSSLINSKCSTTNRLSKVRILKDGEAASIKYLTNAQGQQVFKSEPKPDQYLPNAAELGTGFIAWLKTNFGWLYAQAQTDASLGSAYMYADGQLPGWAVLGEYDNGSASGTGRTEYIWLPTEDGSAVPVGMFRNSKFFAIHSDHLGTPRLMTDSLNKPVWQWPYSAFGNNKPTGILKPTNSATGAFMNQPVLLATQTPAAVLDLRFPGQMADEETGLFYNYFRTYQPSQGRYTQNDPIGLAGGSNRFGYANQNALSYTDPTGQLAFAIPFIPAIITGADLAIGAGLGILGYGLDRMYAKPPENAYDPKGPKAPGKPTEADGFKSPKGGDSWVPNPNPGKGGSGYGWEDSKGDVWCPTGSGGRSHSGPHWDVQTPGANSGYRNVKPKQQ